MSLDTFKPKIIYIFMQMTIIAAVSMSALADTPICEKVDAQAPDHQPVLQLLTDRVGIYPKEFAYCQHDKYPRWIARWTPFEDFISEGEIWRRYATAKCFDRNGVLECYVTTHVAMGSSHVVVDIEHCDVSIAVITDIHRAVSRDYPGYEMNEIEVSTVLDGGAWSAVDYGYNITLIAPPKFDGGVVQHYMQRCNENTCSWYDKGIKATWYASTNDLPGLRRKRGDPLIEYFEP